MANRPSYMRTREPGQYTITSTSSSPGSNTSTPSYSKLPGVAGVPGLFFMTTYEIQSLIKSFPGLLTSMSSEQRKSFGTLPGSRTLPDFPKSGVEKSVSLPRKSSANIDSGEVAVHEGRDPVQELMAKLPPAPNKVDKF